MALKVMKKNKKHDPRKVKRGKAGKAIVLGALKTFRMKSSSLHPYHLEMFLEQDVHLVLFYLLICLVSFVSILYRLWLLVFFYLLNLPGKLNARISAEASNVGIGRFAIFFAIPLQRGVWSNVISDNRAFEHIL